MRGAKLTILAALSLIILAILAWGYVGQLGLDFQYASTTPWGIAGRHVVAGVENGQFVIEWQYSPYPAGFPRAVHLFPYYRFKPSLTWASFWTLHIARNVRAPGIGAGKLECPLWFAAALPFTIAPIVWLRRRRRRETRGFAVEGSQTSEPASEQPNPPPELPTDQQTPTYV